MKCRGRHRYPSLKSAWAVCDQRDKAGVAHVEPYFCALCAGLHIQRPAEDPPAPVRA